MDDNTGFEASSSQNYVYIMPCRVGSYCVCLVKSWNLSQHYASLCVVKHALSKANFAKSLSCGSKKHSETNLDAKAGFKASPIQELMQVM